MMSRFASWVYETLVVRFSAAAVSLNGAWVRETARTPNCGFDCDLPACNPDHTRLQMPKCHKDWRIVVIPGPGACALSHPPLGP